MRSPRSREHTFALYVYECEVMRPRAMIYGRAARLECSSTARARQRARKGSSWRDDAIETLKPISSS